MRDRVVSLARLAMAAGLAAALSTPAKAEDSLLHEVVEFTGAILFLSSGVPGLVIGITRDGETEVAGFGETVKGSGRTPDGDTLMRIGSVTKAFTGHVLASLAADGTVGLADPLQDRLGWDVTVPEMDGHAIRLIELATHSSGLPREVERGPSPPDDPFRTLTAEAYQAGLQDDPLLFAPGTGLLYSNFAFDLLAVALGNADGKPYDQVLKERVLDPVGLTDTMLTHTEADTDRLMQGHDFDGSPLPDVVTGPVMAGASGLYSTTNDILKWLDWHLDRFSPEGAQVRLIDHASWVQRDGMRPAAGLDESGRMDAMALGWIVMQPDGDRPLILQKAGGLQGMLVYAAFAPNRGVGGFVAINQFNFGAAAAASETLNNLISELAPR